MSAEPTDVPAIYRIHISLSLLSANAVHGAGSTFRSLRYSVSNSWSGVRSMTKLWTATVPKVVTKQLKSDLTN